MRVMHISSLYLPDQVGGAEVLVAALAAELVAAGDEVAVACLSRQAQEARTEDGVEVYRLGHGQPFFVLDWGEKSRLQRIAYKVSTQAGVGLGRLREAVSAFQPDVVNTHALSELSPRIWPMVAGLGVPVVHTLHDFSGLCTNGAMFKDGGPCARQHAKCRAYGALHGFESRSVDAVVGVGRDILDRHIAAGHFRHLDAARRKVIWNPIEPPAPRPPRSREDGERVFGFLGRIEPSKGVDLLLEACRRLPPSGWRLRIAGRAVDGDAPYRAQAAGLPVEFLGYTDRDAFFEGIDCLVAPPLWPEAFGRTVAEAYLRGVPVIGADIAGVAEQVGAVDPRQLFRPGDPTSLAMLMQAFIDNPERGRLNPDQVSVFAKRVEPKNIAAQYRALYVELLAEQGALGGIARGA